MKILVFNVKYSPNLGDGVLAECLERGLRRCGPDVAVETMDLAGRNGYQVPGIRRMKALSALRNLPPRLRGVAVKLALARRLRTLWPEWRARIEAADAVVIGGGNLFQDDDLNFPLKVGAVLEEVHRAGKPLAVYAVGVTRHWSTKAETLFGRLRQCRVAHISVRDHGARENWMAHFGRWYPVDVCPDPGLLARDLLADEGIPYVGPPLIALCITHPLILQRHAGIAGDQIPLRTAADYRRLAEWLIAGGCRVMLFTNGADEDRRFLDEVLDHPASRAYLAAGSLETAAHPRTPEDLVKILNRPAAIVAHRLHASIVAYALGVPAVGLGWDGKVEKFFEFVGRKAFFLQGDDVSPEEIGARAVEAAEEGVVLSEHAKCVGSAKSAIARLVEQLRAAVVQ